MDISFRFSVCAICRTPCAPIELNKGIETCMVGHV